MQKNPLWNTGAVPRSSILYKFRQSSIRKEHTCFKYFVGISAKKEKKKEKSCCEIFRDNNHQSLYKNI